MRNHLNGMTSARWQDRWFSTLVFLTAISKHRQYTSVKFSVPESEADVFLWTTKIEKKKTKKSSFPLISLPSLSPAQCLTERLSLGPDREPRVNS